jgi:hypothetical protein
MSCTSDPYLHSVVPHVVVVLGDHLCRDEPVFGPHHQVHRDVNQVVVRSDVQGGLGAVPPQVLGPAVVKQLEPLVLRLRDEEIFSSLVCNERARHCSLKLLNFDRPQANSWNRFLRIKDKNWVRFVK